MKFFIAIIFFLNFVSINLQAQDIAPDFTLTDINGVTRNLYTELDNGKSVILEFFMTNCGTCQINTSSLENFWQSNGYNGDSLWVWSIEINGVSDSAIQVFYNQFPATFPSFSTQYSNSVINDYGVTYAPVYFSICPNRYMKTVSIESIELDDVSCPVSEINESRINNSITFKYSLYESVIKINLLNEELPALVSVYSPDGTLLLKNKINEHESGIDLKDYKSGLYIITCISVSGNHFSDKILKLF